MTGVSGGPAGPDRDPRDPIDPLLADPAIPTGQTGAIERPGDDRPAWLVPVLGVVLIGFVAVLAAVAAQRDDTSDETDADAGAGAGTELVDEDANTGGGATRLPPEDLDPVDDDRSAGTDAPPSDPDDTVPDVASTVDRPVGSGTIVIDGTETPIVSACEDHRPFAPADESVRTSVYAFRAADGTVQIIARHVRPDGPDASVVEWVGRDLSALAAGGDPVGPLEVELVGADGGGGDGADVGDPVSVALDPAGSNGLGCDSLVVTNEPGQFAFPTSRVVVAACSGSTDDPAIVSGLLSTGGRFGTTASDSAPSPDDTATETTAAGTATSTLVELRIVDADPVSGESIEYVDVDADAFVDADQRSFSGLVERDDSGTVAPAALDATVDLRVGNLEPCGDDGP